MPASFAVTVTGAPLIKSLQSMADELTVLSGLTPELGQALLAREVDLLITSDAMEDAEGIERRIVLHEPFVLAIPRAAEASLESGSMAELALSMPMIRYTTHSNIGIQIERHLRRLGLEVPKRLELDSSNSVMTMVAAGLGWAITTPLCMVQGRSMRRLSPCNRCAVPLSRRRCSCCIGATRCRPRPSVCASLRPVSCASCRPTRINDRCRGC